MAIADRIQALRRASADVRFRVRTVATIGRRIGMIDALTPSGARVLARELAKGKVNASLLFRYHGANDPSRTALVEANAPILACRGAPASELVDADRAWSFHELDVAMEKLGASLSRRGIKKGDKALLILKNRAEFVILQTALARIGVSAVTSSWRGTPPEIEFVAKHAEARAIFFDVDIAPTIKETLARLDPAIGDHAYAVGGRARGFLTYEDLLEAAAGAAPDASDEACVVMYTSGTTGKPKGAVRKFQKDALASALAFVGETPMRMHERHLAVCPLYHATAFGFTALSYMLAATVFVLPEFRPEVFLDAVQRYRITTTAVVPTMLYRVLELGPDVLRRYDTSSLKAVFTGGAALSAPLANAFLDQFGDVLFNFYGATETGLVTIATPQDLRLSPGSIGHRVPGVEIRLLDEASKEVKDGEVGELYARSSMLVEGYHADLGATDDAMRDGFFSVGDLARKDTRGCYLLEGRKRDMIISGGVNVYPAEVEQAIESLDGVAEVAVVGVPDSEWGERVRAFVVPKKGASIDEATLKAHCKERLAGPKIPRDFVVLEALPRNPTGKILKRELRNPSFVAAPIERT